MTEDEENQDAPVNHSWISTHPDGDQNPITYISAQVIDNIMSAGYYFNIKHGGGRMIDQNSCGALIKQIHDELEKNANNAMRIQNITMAQCVALVVLHGAPEQQMSLKELERQLHVAQSTAAGVVARLEQKELVESFGSPEDRRIKIVRLTPAGVERCRMAEQNMQEAEENLLSGLTETERSIFLSLLKKVRDTL